MDPDQNPISRTTTVPRTQIPTPAPSHAGDRRLDCQQHADGSQPYAASALEIGGHDEPVHIDGEQSAKYESHRKPIDEHYNLNDSTRAMEQELRTNDREEVAAVVSEHGEGDVVRLQKEREATQPAVFEPIPVPTAYAPLSFRPTLLQTKWIATLAILYLAIAAAIYGLLRASEPDYLFTVSNENVHLIARYGPGLTATVTVLLFRQTVRDAIRMKPFFEMADQKATLTQGANPKKSVAGAYFPFQAPGLTPPSFIYLFLFFVQIVVSFLVAFKSILLGTEQSGSVWKVTIRTSAAIYLIAGYGLMALVNFVIIIWAWSRSTGLKWDPVSLADFFALFARCNALDTFEMLEHDWKNGKLRGTRKSRAAKLMSSRGGSCFRIGYWISKTRNQAHELSSEIVYGIGVVENNEIVYGSGIVANNKNICIPGSTIQRKQYLGAGSTENNYGVHNMHESQGRATDRDRQADDRLNTIRGSKHSIAEPCLCKTRPRCQHYPYRVATGLSIPFLIFWILVVTAASSLCILGLASGAIAKGGFSINAWEHNANSSSVSNSTSAFDVPWYSVKTGSMASYAFVFRALPTQVAGQFAIAYLPTLDTHMRFTQPFVGMFDEAGDAANTIALSYLTASSLEVPLHAFHKGHWKVAWFAILATLAALFPVLVSALFTITQTGSQVYLALDWPTFAMVMGYLLAFNVSLPFAWPTRSRRQPRYIISLADIMGMCHQARFLADPLFDIASPASSKEKMDAQLLLRENKYLLGRYLGRDGRTHLGFDVSETDIGGPTGTVKWIPPKAGYIREAEQRPSVLYRLFQKKHGKFHHNDSDEGIKLRHIRNRSGPSLGEQHGQPEQLSHSTAVQIRQTV